MKKIIILSLFMISQAAFSQDVPPATETRHVLAATIGIRSNHVIPNGNVFSSKDLIKFQAGLLTYLPLNDNLTFRTGGVLVMRDVEGEGTGTFSGITLTTNRLFLDIPATLQFGSEKIHAYAGVNIGIRVSSSCSISGTPATCTIDGEKSIVFQPVLGIDFAVTPIIKIGGFYELETAYDDDSKQNAFGLNGAYLF